ncbi:MAG TPA: carbon starvation CstA family protein [Oscillatoriaceae cyanobacterium]
MNRLRDHVILVGLALLLASAIGVFALRRGEHVSALWIVIAALCSYAIGYRYYARFLAQRVMGLDDRRMTPAHKREDGRDYVPTKRWVLFGHHFAAIAGAGPLVGPILAAQFGYLPGLLWIVVGVVLGGAVQDFVILFGSMRRDGHSLGQMAKDEMGPVAGFTAMLSVLAIMVILLATLAFVVVKALAMSPWGTFTIAMTIPIALLVGFYMRVIRPGKILEASAIGLVLLLFALVGGRYIAADPTLAHLFTFDARTLAWALIIYGFLASVVPVWMLLAPRDYLSTFVKIGTIALMAAGIFFTAPMLQMPAMTRFVDGSGPIVAGGLFPFCFITIACGAVSGFHSLIASGTTPKMIERESDAPLIGYGGMLCESFVAVMAVVAASVLQPGVFFAVNASVAATGATPDAVAAAVTGWGFPVSAAQMADLARSVGEITLFNRTGGAPTFALGMADVFSRAFGGPLLRGLWYHFAIMFEALFILTSLDAGTRVGRFMLQDMLGHLWAPLGRTDWWPGTLATSAAVVAGWGWFLYQGVCDPYGGINSLWPLFGIANQLLAAVALCVGTTILLKMHRARFAWVTLLPLAWLSAVTFSAGWEKVLSASPKIGLLAHAAMLQAKITTHAIPLDKLAETQALIRNDGIDAALALLFMALTCVILAVSAWQWAGLLLRNQATPLRESPVEYFPEVAV